MLYLLNKAFEWTMAIIILGIEAMIIFFLLGVIFISLLVSPQ